MSRRTARGFRVLALAVAALAVGATAALSDGLYGDADADTIFTAGGTGNVAAFGDVCTGDTETFDVPLKLARIGTSDSVIYKSGTTATITTSVITAQTGMSVGVSGGATIPVPADWAETAATIPPRLTGDQVTGRVTLVAGATPRTVSGEVRFLGGGTNKLNAAFTRNLTVPVTANVIECNTPPVLTVPADIVATVDALGGATVSYTGLSATDTEDGDLTDEIECTPPSGSFFAVGGPHTVSCSVEDSGGLTDTGSFTVTVRYAFTGFFAPVDGTDDPTVLNVVKAGSSVPVKFALGGDQGLAVLDTSITPNPRSTAVVCTSGADEDPVETTASSTANAGGLIYDADAGQYVYVWKTSSSFSKGSCRKLTVSFADGTSHSAYFRFR